MRTLTRKFITSLAGTAIAFSVCVAGNAMAEDPATTHEAAKHFQRGVTLYNEADYRAALVEFRRAYEVAPNVAVLYNIGETEFQLQDYAAALTAFERYVAESSGADPHKAEVEHNLDVLRARVGRLSISTSPPGADVAIDDQAVGRTPFEKPVLVSIGHRKITVSMEGRPSTTRYVDVAADDNESISVQLSDPVQAGGPQPLTGDPQTTTKSSVGPALRIAGWVGTAVLAAGAGTTGVLALMAEKDLQNAKSTFPSTVATLNNDANHVHTFSIIADSLTAGAVVVGGITLYSTLSSLPHAPKDSAIQPQVTLTPRSLRAGFSF